VAAKDNDKSALFGGLGKGATDFTNPNRNHDQKQDALGNKIADPDEELKLIEKEMHELRVAFEQYFMGADRKAPTRRRDLLWERLRKLKSNANLTTGTKYRLEHMYAKYSAFDRVWIRTLSEIEAGTYGRDLYKMKLRQGTKAKEAAPAPVKAAPVSKRPSMLTDGQLQTLYDTYVVARQRTNEPTQGITLAGLAKTLDKQVPQLIEQFGCKAVDFKVVIKNNKAVLKAIPRK
jgi:hypothetical protein